MEGLWSQKHGDEETSGPDNLNIEAPAPELCQLLAAYQANVSLTSP